MPPQVIYYHPSITPQTPLLPRVSAKSRLNRILHHTYGQGVGRRMKFAKRNFIPVLLFILCSASIFRFLNISIFANFSVSLPSAALPLIHHRDCSSSPSSTCRKNNTSYSQAPSTSTSTSTTSTTLTEKETRFILNLFSQRVPCNLLVFGSADQYSSIANLNADGNTIFLEDYLDNTSTTKPANNTRVYKIMYNTVASKAFKLLKDARGNHDCLPKFNLPKSSRCNLALLNLPREVYDTMWDVVMVDGPNGAAPDSPGRMASIYTASMLARRGNTTHVVVHDVDRMIEKWFSREFLCEENLVSSKGRFWHFQIATVITNATAFCIS